MADDTREAIARVLHEHLKGAGSWVRATTADRARAFEAVAMMQALLAHDRRPPETRSFETDG